MCRLSSAHWNTEFQLQFTVAHVPTSSSKRQSAIEARPQQDQFSGHPTSLCYSCLPARWVSPAQTQDHISEIYNKMIQQEWRNWSASETRLNHSKTLVVFWRIHCESWHAILKRGYMGWFKPCDAIRSDATSRQGPIISNPYSIHQYLIVPVKLSATLK